MSDIIATMTLVEVGTSKILAGHALAPIDGNNECVLVLRKRDAEHYDLHAFPVSEADQGLRSFLAAEQSEHGELVTAVAEALAGRRGTPRHTTRRTRKRTVTKAGG